MRHFDMTADLFGLLFKAHHELSQRALRMPLGQLPSPLDVRLNIGEAPSQFAQVRLQVRNGELAIVSADHGRSIEFRAPVAGLASCDASAPVSLTYRQQSRETEAYMITPAVLHKFKAPADFRELHGMLLEHLYQLFPNLTPAHAAFKLTETTLGSAAAAAREGKEANLPASAEPEFEAHLVHRSNQPDLRFEGKRIAAVRSPLFRGRCFLHEVFETKSGKFIGVRRGISTLLGEREEIETVVCATKQELVAFFGYSALAKALYAQLGVTCEEVIA